MQKLQVFFHGLLLAGLGLTDVLAVLFFNLQSLP